MLSRHVRGLALGLALVAAAAPFARAEEPEAEIDPAQVAGVVLEMLNTLDESDVDSCKAAITRLTEIEPERRIGLLHAYATVAGDSVHPFRRELLDIVLDRLGTSGLRNLLRDATSAESTLMERTLALRLIREREVPDSINLVMDAGMNEEEINLARLFVQRSFRETFAVVLQRDPRGADAVERRFSGLPGPIQDVILDVLEKRIEDFGTLEMSRLLGSEARLNRSILPRLARLPIVRPQPLTIDATTHVAWSMDVEDPATRRFALVVAARFHMTSYVDDMLRLMDDREPRVAAAAHRALSVISGARLISRSELWETWLEGERDWGTERLAGVLESARSHDEETALSGLQQLARHRFHREAIVPRLDVARTHTSPTVRRLTCETLGVLGSPQALPALADRLDDGDPAVVVAASDAIHRITGLPTPEDASEWHAVLRLDI